MGSLLSGLPRQERTAVETWSTTYCANNTSLPLCLQFPAPISSGSFNKQYKKRTTHLHSPLKLSNFVLLCINTINLHKRNKKLHEFVNSFAAERFTGAENGGGESRLIDRIGKILRLEANGGLHIIHSTRFALVFLHVIACVNL